MRIVVVQYNAKGHMLEKILRLFGGKMLRPPSP
jgi:hypothetical protein